tara:strand:+ start:15108 stop:16136 length:1029 start_codon:yes stop_codon:yes gene_type:complete
VTQGSTDYEALLLVAFGGPEAPDQVEPFLERVTAGRRIPAERLAEVADRYARVGGVSPINGRLRNLVDSVEVELRAVGSGLPVYWGNRNAPPLLTDTLAEMSNNGVRRALAWIASPYSSHSTCRRYRDDIETACSEIGPSAPQVDVIRPHHDHPGLIQPAADRLVEALRSLPADDATVLFSAHSLPADLAATCDYEAQVDETAGLVAERAGLTDHQRWEVVWQSRSGHPGVPWLEPDVSDRVQQLGEAGVRSVAVSPVGFPVENFEVVWDLDIEAAEHAARAGMNFARAECIDNDPRFVAMIGDLAAERTDPDHTGPAALGQSGVRPHECPADCCPGPASPA